MSTSTLLARWRSLPSLRVLARVILPGTAHDGEQPATATPLAARVRRLPADAVIVQRAPLDSWATVELARGCWGSARRVHVEWPGDTQTGAPFRQAFLDWHRPLIRAGLLPFVTVERDITPFLRDAALVYPDHDRGGPR